MEVKKTQEGSKLVVTVSGCLDTSTSPDLQADLETALAGITDLMVDFTNLEYISSAGFRVLLMANKKIVAGGGVMSVKGCSPAVREVFDMTGFSDIFNML